MLSKWPYMVTIEPVSILFVTHSFIGAAKKKVEVDDNPPDESEMQAFPSIEEAAMKAAGIRPGETDNVTNKHSVIY